MAKLAEVKSLGSHWLHVIYAVSTGPRTVTVDGGDADRTRESMIISVITQDPDIWLQGHLGDMATSNPARQGRNNACSSLSPSRQVQAEAWGRARGKLGRSI
jgi:hypothetical protein